MRFRFCVAGLGTGDWKQGTLMDAEVVPAILVKTREELLHRISQVRGLVKEIQIDIMDGVFVPNKTIGLEDLRDLPDARYEFHWMVKDPERWIEKTPGPYTHLVHIETIKTPDAFERVARAVEKAGGRVGLAINPETPLDVLLPYLDRVSRVLVMTVHPGFSGQSYIRELESKIKKLRRLRPSLDIEVDGGVNEQTISHAYAAGANVLAAASAIFSSKNIRGAIENLKRCAVAGCPA